MATEALVATSFGMADDPLGTAATKTASVSGKGCFRQGSAPGPAQPFLRVA
jgi:hypothetical protein